MGSIVNASFFEWTGAICFALAIAHTFSVQQFAKLANRFSEGSVRENLFHLLAEVEVVFGLWAAIFLGITAAHGGMEAAVHYLNERDFTEPLFVLVVLSVCATRPILQLASTGIQGIAALLPWSHPLSVFVTTLTLGPILGSIITEPAAMTVTAMILASYFFRHPISERLKYSMLGLLFVNISIGGVLTPYAAPPVLMVADTFGWDLAFMLSHFGWRAALATICNTALVAFYFRRELNDLALPGADQTATALKVPAWVLGVQTLFLASIVTMSHHATVFMAIFLFFLGWVQVSREYQDELLLRSGLLVAFFLGGLVVFGESQRWWLGPVLQNLSADALYYGCTALTAITDNAALTYLGSQVRNLASLSQYALVAGAVSGGGLTVIANAPNPAGYGILNQYFKDGISPLRLFLGALGPTLIAVLCFWLI